MSHRPLRLDIIIDTVCPWCYIGKRRLEQALAERPNIHVQINWWPFMLNPTMPESGMDRQDYLNRKFGGEARAQRVYTMIANAGKTTNIPFDFDAITTTPNSLHSHRLITFASEHSEKIANKITEDVFRSFFIEGKNIGDLTVLRDIGLAAGLAPDRLEEMLLSDENKDDIIEADQKARQIGVQAVPAFIVDNGYILAGAQEPKIIARFLDVAWSAANP